MNKQTNIVADKTAKLVSIGNSTGIILPKELLDRLGLKQGDKLSVTETPDGISLRISEEEFEAQMKVAREVMERRRSALRELAK